MDRKVKKKWLALIGVCSFLTLMISVIIFNIISSAPRSFDFMGFGYAESTDNNISNLATSPNSNYVVVSYDNYSDYHIYYYRYYEKIPFRY